MTLRRCITCFAFVSAMILSACSNEEQKLSPKTVKDLITSSIEDRRKQDERIDPDILIQAQSINALEFAEPDLPLASVRFDSAGIASVVRRIETNGQHTVWAAWGTDDRKSFVTKNGVIVATRGLFKDLMSAEADDVIGLVQRREEGVAPYMQRYLDGDFQIIEAKSTCTVSRGYEKTVSLATGPVPALQMFSSCVSANRQFVDLYLVGPSGRILEMRQWVGPLLGFAYMKHLR